MLDSIGFHPAAATTTVLDSDSRLQSADTQVNCTKESERRSLASKVSRVHPRVARNAPQMPF